MLSWHFCLTKCHRNLICVAFYLGLQRPYAVSRDNPPTRCEFRAMAQQFPNTNCSVYGLISINGKEECRLPFLNTDTIKAVRHPGIQIILSYAYLFVSCRSLCVPLQYILCEKSEISIAKQTCLSYKIINCILIVMNKLSLKYVSH